MRRQEVHMQRIGELFRKENKNLLVRVALIALLGLFVLAVSHPANRGLGQSVGAARPALEATEIDLLERQNRAYERIVKAITPANVIIPHYPEDRTVQLPFLL